MDGTVCRGWGAYRAHRALEEDDVPRLPHLDDGHARNVAVGVGLGGGVHRVVRADHHRDVLLLHNLVDLLHFQHLVVGDTRLGEQHVELPRHAPGHRVHRELHIFALLRQGVGDGRDRALRLGDCQTVAGTMQTVPAPTSASATPSARISV